MLAKGFVLLISIGFAAGVIRLSKKQVPVHKLHSLENPAHCDTVCVLTKAERLRKEFYLLKRFLRISAKKNLKNLCAHI